MRRLALCFLMVFPICAHSEASAQQDAQARPALPDPGKFEICRKQGTVIMAAYEAFNAGVPESQTLAALNERQDTAPAKAWVKSIAGNIYGMAVSPTVDSSSVYAHYQVECLKNKNLYTLYVRLPRGSAGD